MRFRVFQIFAPLLAIWFIYRIVQKFRRSEVSCSEAATITLFWIAISTIAIFPDNATRWLALVTGIESNVNALLFLAIGALLFLQSKLYFMMKKQDSIISSLTRRIALDKIEESGVEMAKDLSATHNRP